MYYSKTTNGFYDLLIHGINIPSDAVEISFEHYQELLLAQSTGALIQPNSSGYPIAATPSAKTLPECIDNKLQKLAAYRFERETAGITISGSVIATDRESQALLTGAYLALKEGFCETKRWKGINGWVTLSLAEMEPIARAVDAHVQGCFDNEAIHSAAIQALTLVESIESYDFTGGWPE